MLWKILVLVAVIFVPAIGRAQDSTERLTTSVLERMDRRLEEVNQKLVTDLTELRSTQKEMIQHLQRVDRLEQQMADMQARVAKLEGRSNSSEARSREPDRVARKKRGSDSSPSVQPLTADDLNRMENVIDGAVKGMKRAEERYDAAVERYDAAVVRYQEAPKPPVRINDRPAVRYGYPSNYPPPPPFPGFAPSYVGYPGYGSPSYSSQGYGGFCSGPAVPYAGASYVSRQW